MGAQASTVDGRNDGRLHDSDDESITTERRAVTSVTVERATTVETVIADAPMTVKPIVSSSPLKAPRPPVAPPRVATAININADRVISVGGTIKRAYPLQDLSGDDAGSSEGDAFCIGTGPCGRDATLVVAWEVQMRDDSYQSCYVFLYDKWAEAVRDFQRMYRVDVKGSGLVVIDHWDIGHDTEDVKRCYVVAESQVLKKTMERSPRLLPKAQGVTIELAFEEAMRIEQSDQVKYLDAKIIHARELYAPADADRRSREKEVQQAMAKSNRRGKRQLKAISADEASAAITTPSSYIYTPIAELNPGNANLYGVVVNMSLPKRSEGKDSYMTIQLVDESCPKREDALQVTVFLPSIEDMPRIMHVGDVVRVHKIRINRYHDRWQGVCFSGVTRYLVLRRGPNNSIEQQTCSGAWTFEKYDKERFHQLANWADRALRVDVTLPPGCLQPSRLLGDMQYAESYADVVVRVLHVQGPYTGFTAPRFIIWDGSGDAATCNDLYTKLHRERKARPTSVPFIPESGLLMEIVVDSCWVVMETLGYLSKLTSHWCRFRNLAVASEQGNPTGAAVGGIIPMKQWYELHFREVSSVMFVPQTTPEVQIRESCTLVEAAVDEAVGNGVVTAPPQIPHVETSVPSFILDKVPVASLQTVLTSVHVPRKYHCVGRVVKLWPRDVEQIVKKKSDGGFLYSFVMRLQDTTGELDVIVYGEDAEKFLHGIPPCDLSTSTSSRALLEKRFASLLAQVEPFHFCIKSYRPKEPSAHGTNGGVRFRLFDTVLQVQQ